MRRTTRSTWEDVSSLLNLPLGILGLVSFFLTISVLFFGDSWFGESSDLRYSLSNLMYTPNSVSRCVFIVNRGQLNANDVDIIMTSNITNAITYYDKGSFNSEPNINEDKSIGRTTFQFSKISRGEEGVLCIGSTSQIQHFDVLIRDGNKVAIENVYQRSQQENLFFQILGVVAAIFTFLFCLAILWIRLLSNKVGGSLHQE